MKACPVDSLTFGSRTLINKLNKSYVTEFQCKWRNGWINL